MNKILFKGKTIATNEWIYGGYNQMDDKHFIVQSGEYPDYQMCMVHPESVGQYIGQDDSIGDPIFEKDIVYVPAEDEYANVDWDEPTSRFILNFDGWCCCFDHFRGSELEVAGNTFEGKWWEET